MKKANRKYVRYEHKGKRFSSYRDFTKSVRKSEHDMRNWKETTGFFSGILLRPVGNRRHKQFSKAGYWVNEYWNRIQEERSRACWGGPLY